MQLIIYILIFMTLNAYVIWRALLWLSHCDDRLKALKYRLSFIIVFCVLASLIIITFFLEKTPQFAFLHSLSSKWFGILFYIIFYIAIADILRLIVKLVLKVSFHGKYKDILRRKKVILSGGIVVILLIAFTSIVGFTQVHNLKTTSYEVDISKDCNNVDSLRIVMVADLHLGYITGVDYMNEMVDRINELQPDIVCFAGDIFDNDFNSIDDPEGIRDAWLRIESKYGVYACWGNHDVEEQLFSGFSVGDKKDALRDIRMDELLEDSNIIALGDEYELIDNSFYLIGRLDYFNIGDGTNNRKSISELMEGIDLSKPVILMDHQPRELSDIANAGVDIDLSGHTHKGQMFPMNFTNRVEWENNYGMLKLPINFTSGSTFENHYGVLQKEQMYSIVTSGIGVYGPAMRVMTNSEVVAIDVNFD